MTSDRPDADSRARRRRTRRKLSSALRLLAALAIMGGLSAALAPAGNADDAAPELSGDAKRGKQLYDTSCITCHGRDAQGVDGLGPSLEGVGSAAVEFQVDTGRMPLAQPNVQPRRKPPQFSKKDSRDLGQYVQELGGGPQLPAGESLRASGEEALATGGELFRVNCASCHAFSANGGALSSGKFAPSLDKSTDRQIYAAMLTGPQNMPVFGNNQLTDEQKREIIAYVQHMKADKDPGGFGMGRYGPVPEGVAIFGIGVVALIFAALWVSGKS